MKRTLMGIALVALLSGCGRARPPVAAGDMPLPFFDGPDHVSVDLLRPSPSGPRIYVQAMLPDGEPGLFMIDTGADISVLSKTTAERLGLEVQDTGRELSGLAGTAPLKRAVVDQIQIGEAIIPAVDFAVDVPGVPEQAGWMPQDGILGNNVWSRFLLEIDYPSDTLVLHRPGTQKLPRKWSPMFFDGFVNTPIEVTTAAQPPHTDQVIIQVDTGASGLILSGSSGAGIFEHDYTEGLEPLFGIGGSDSLPASQYNRSTRRLPIDSVRLGGTTVDELDVKARWINYEGQRFGPQNLQGLAGHELMEHNVVWIDYQGSGFALTRSKRKKRENDGHALLLAQDIDEHGPNAASRRVYRAKLHIGLDELDTSIELLTAHLKDTPDDHESRILLANLHRSKGELVEAWQVLEPIDIGALVDEHQVVASVNGLLLEERTDEALALADAAIEARPDEPSPYVAKADALLFTGKVDEANKMLLQAARVSQNPDAYLDRRARTAMATDDRYGAMAHLRKMLQIYPYRGPFMWFYSMMLDDTDESTFRADMQHAMGRLHPFQRPIDFMVASHHQLGDQELALELRAEGIARDCDDARNQALRDNCIAWYNALAGHDPDGSLALVESALEAEGERSDFLDTKAVIHLVRGEYDLAHQSALAAARLQPDDVYMLWQAERIAQLARDAGSDLEQP